MEKSTKKFGLLIVDDEPGIREIYKDALENHFLLGPSWDSIFDCGDGKSALEYIKNYKEEYHLIVIADAYMGPNCENNEIKDNDQLFGGLWLIDEVNKNDELKGFVTILLITFYNEKIKSYRMGNDLFKWVEEKDYYYVEKPRANARINNQIGATEALSIIEDSEEIKKLFERTFSTIRKITIDKEKEDVKECNEYHEIIGKSQAIKETICYAKKAADSDYSVLLLGESGTGKEMIANAIHYKSSRASMPFIKVNCASLSEGIIESEIFGHEKGAFTGAEYARVGRFELANNGTIFLDEIGDISPVTQVKLLRVLQEKEFERLGGNETIKVNVRVIAATNKNLMGAVTQKLFREDLYYRLNVIPITLPPLRERKEDILLLVDYFLKKDDLTKSKICKFNNEALKLLQDYNWPGNIRQLQNIVTRTLLFREGNEISKKEVEDALAKESNNESLNKVTFNNSPTYLDVRKEYLHYVLDKTKKSDGTPNLAAAGRLAGKGLGGDAIKNNIEEYAKNDESFKKYLP